MAPPPDKQSVHVLVWIGLILVLLVGARFAWMKYAGPPPEPTPARVVGPTPPPIAPGVP